ncbi:hypothetical protein V6N13_121614 [Hibiscus sabdariffa]|uniref:Uncharacterized protein n=1 Tax=Hibiscus sabdariffa TaxID=183260 RepID=A0ABR2PDR4_9ROSI
MKTLLICHWVACRIHPVKTSDRRLNEMAHIPSSLIAFDDLLEVKWVKNLKLEDMEFNSIMNELFDSTDNTIDGDEMSFSVEEEIRIGEVPVENPIGAQKNKSGERPYATYVTGVSPTGKESDNSLTDENIVYRDEDVQTI